MIQRDSSSVCDQSPDRQKGLYDETLVCNPCALHAVGVFIVRSNASSPDNRFTNPGYFAIRDVRADVHAARLQCK
jgi:hypothetical protein